MCVWGGCVCATELRRGTVGLPSPDGAGTQTQPGWQRWHAQPSHSWLCQPPCSPSWPRLGRPAASSHGSPTDRRTGLLDFPQLVWGCLIQHTAPLIQGFTMQQTREMHPGNGGGHEDSCHTSSIPLQAAGSELHSLASIVPFAAFMSECHC